MRAVTKIATLMLTVWPAVAGDVTVYVHITKRLTKKAVAPLVYDLRGTAPAASAGTEPPINELDRTVVMLVGKNPAPAQPQTITIEQRNSRFEPDLAIVPVGSTVEFPNFDPIFHNVFSLSNAHQFDLGFYPKGKSKSEKFDRAGVVQVYCHIHANMYGAIVVTDSPWYGRPQAAETAVPGAGTVVLKGVPAGHYKAEAWHKIAGLYKADVDVPATGIVQVHIQVPLTEERK
jgi:plastocyanin